MADEAEIFLYSEIGPEWAGMVSDIALINALDQLKNAKKIHLRINSPGGDAMMGVSMYNALQRHPAKIIAHVDALCGSAATIAAIGADKLVMHAGSLFVIHKSMTIMYGNEDEMRKVADVLATVDKNIVDMYHRKSGLDRSKVLAMMAEETWMTPDDAVKLGFADEADVAPTGVTASVPKGWYAKAPSTIARYTPDTRKTSALTGLTIAAKAIPATEIESRRAHLESLKTKLLVA